MPLEIVRNDITKMEVDAIVNAANESLLGGGGVDGCIHKAAGKELLEECRTLGGCKTGDAKITKGYALPCKYVIHTVGPVWHSGEKGEKALLESCYRKSLAIAKEKGFESVAFPLISSGVYGYPKDKALRVAVDVISEFLFENDMTVYIVIFDKTSYKISEKLFSDIKEYIGDAEAEEMRLADRTEHPQRRRRIGILYHANNDAEECSARYSRGWIDASMPCADSAPFDSASLEDESLNKLLSPLDELLDSVDESFSQMLLRKIDEKGMTDSECYKKANIDRKLFSKIRGDVYYKPRKQTAIAFAIALELSLSETEEMLKKAGYALSHSNKFDIIIEYFITHNNYNVFEINEALFAFDQNLLGA